jgi:hypothetical protein
MRIGPDTCRRRTPTWALIKARVCSVLEPWDPTMGGPDPIRGGGVWIPFQGSGPYMWGSWTKLGGPDCISRGSVLSHGGPNSLLMSWSISLSLDTWRPRTRLCGGVKRCCWPIVVARGWGESWPGPTYSSFTTRLKIVAWVLHLYTVVRGTLVSGYRQWPLGPPQERMRACRWGQSLYFMRRFSMSADAPTVNPPSVTPTAISVSAAD